MAVQAHHDVFPVDDAPLETAWRNGPSLVLGELAGEAAVRRKLLSDYQIEGGGGLGALAGEIWRIGLMGENARPENVARLLEALKKELR